jgi:hypothetical protein
MDQTPRHLTNSFFQNQTQTAFTVETKQHKNSGYFCNFRETAQSNLVTLLANKTKF